MPNVLLLGDSIRLNYMPYVFRKLADRAVVYGPEENCRYSKYLLWGLEDWMGGRNRHRASRIPLGARCHAQYHA